MPTENVTPVILDGPMTPERVLARLDERLTDTRDEFLAVQAGDLDIYRLWAIMHSYDEAWHFYKVWIKFRA